MSNFKKHIGHNLTVENISGYFGIVCKTCREPITGAIYEKPVRKARMGTLESIRKAFNNIGYSIERNRSQYEIFSNIHEVGMTRCVNTIREAWYEYQIIVNTLKKSGKL